MSDKNAVIGYVSGVAELKMHQHRKTVVYTQALITCAVWAYIIFTW